MEHEVEMVTYIGVCTDQGVEFEFWVRGGLGFSDV